MSLPIEWGLELADLKDSFKSKPFYDSMVHKIFPKSMHREERVGVGSTKQMASLCRKCGKKEKPEKQVGLDNR